MGIELTIKVTLVLVAGHALAFLLRRASASSRHLVWAATTVGALLLAPLVLSMPWRWEVVELGAMSTTPAAVAAVAVDATTPAAPPISPAPPSAALSADEGPGSLPWSPSGIVLALWLAGSAVALLPVLRGMLALRELRGTARPCSDPELVALTDQARSRLGVAEPRLLLSDAVGAPFTSGLLRPVVILPSAATGWSRGRKESVLLHELAHVRRRDLAIHLLARATCAAYWFHPLAWSAARRLRSESERACDDHVLRAGAPASSYASDLLELAEAGARQPGPSFAPSMARASDFEGRLLAILDKGRRRSAESPRATAAAGLLGVALVAVVAVLGSRRAEAAAVLQEDVAPEEAVLQSNGVATALVRLLADPENDVRASAARALGDRRATTAVDALIASLSDPSSSVRRSAAVALGSMDASPAVEALAALALDDPESRVRAAAVWALGETEEDVAVEALARVVSGTRDRDLRRDAVAALGETGRPGAALVLEGMLETSGRRTLEDVLDALAELGPAGGYDILVRLMGSEDARMREMAVEALAEAGD